MTKYDNILDFYKEYIKLEQIVRKGWIMCNVPASRLESVADHTLQLILLASILTKELNIEVESKKLMEMLLIHDVGEAIVGDVSDVEDNYLIVKEKEKEAVKKIFSILSSDMANYYLELWKEMEQKETELARFAYAIDKIDAIIKAGIYEEEYTVEGLFKEFYEFSLKRKSFIDSPLEEFFNYLYEKYNSEKK